jgi:hypothetical protein
MTTKWRVVFYVLTALIAAAHYWAFDYLLRLDFRTQRSIWIGLFLGCLILGWIAVAFWATSSVPIRLRWRGVIRSSVMILAGIGGLLEEAGFANSAWVAIIAAFAAIVISEVFFRAVRRSAAPQP